MCKILACEKKNDFETVNGKIEFVLGKFRRLMQSLLSIAKLANRVNSDINLKSANFTPCKFQKYIKFYTQCKFRRLKAQRLSHLRAENLRDAAYLLAIYVKFRRFHPHAVERV